MKLPQNTRRAKRNIGKGKSVVYLTTKGGLGRFKEAMDHIAKLDDQINESIGYLHTWLVFDENLDGLGELKAFSHRTAVAKANQIHGQKVQLVFRVIHKLRCQQ